MNEKNYKEYGFDVTKPRNAHQLVSLMMFLQARAFGTESFIVNDGRLFGDSSSATDSTIERFVYIGNIGSTAPALRQQNKGGIAADYIIETTICYGPATNRISTKGTIAAQLMPITCIKIYEWIPTGGGSSGSYNPGMGPGGGSGGGSSSTASISSTQYFQQTLGLTSAQLIILNPFPQLAEECFNYLQIADGQLTYEDQKKLVTSHILNLKTNPLYLEYCESISVQNAQAQDKYYPWFKNNTLFSSNSILANNIQNLKLDAQQAYYLLNNQQLNEKINNFRINNNGQPLSDKETAVKSHISGMLTNPAYAAFVNNYEVTDITGKMWWENDVWLDANFLIDLGECESWPCNDARLNQQERAFCRKYPFAMMLIGGNANSAKLTTRQLFNIPVNDAMPPNDKSNAFLHAYFCALNITTSFLTEERVREFAVAHEYGTPQQLQLETTMDLFNNEIGFQIGKANNQNLPYHVNQALINGLLRYLKPIDNNDPLFWGDKTNPSIPETHGISNLTTLVPTNQ